MFFEPREYLRHILVEVDYLLETRRDLTLGMFTSDETCDVPLCGASRSSARRRREVPPDVRSEHPDINWHAMAGMRDRLIHGYFGVDYEIVWDVVKNRIPELRDQMSAILEA